MGVKQKIEKETFLKNMLGEPWDEWVRDKVDRFKKRARNEPLPPEKPPCPIEIYLKANVPMVFRLRADCLVSGWKKNLAGGYDCIKCHCGSTLNLTHLLNCEHLEKTRDILELAGGSISTIKGMLRTPLNTIVTKETLRIEHWKLMKAMKQVRRFYAELVP